MFILSIHVLHLLILIDILVTEGNQGRWIDIIYYNSGMRIQIRQQSEVSHQYIFMILID